MLVITGRRNAMASMITTGNPSAKLGSTRARDAAISSRTCSPPIHPVMRTRCAQIIRLDEGFDFLIDLTVAGKHAVQTGRLPSRSWRAAPISKS